MRRQRYRIKTLWSDNILLAGAGRKQTGWLQCRSMLITVAHSGTRQAFRARMPLTRWHVYLCAKHVNDALNTHPPSVRVEEGGHHFDRSWQVMAQRHANTWSDLSARESRLTRQWERGLSRESVLQGKSFCNYRQTRRNERERENWRHSGHMLVFFQDSQYSHHLVFTFHTVQMIASLNQSFTSTKDHVGITLESFWQQVENTDWLIGLKTVTFRKRLENTSEQKVGRWMCTSGNLQIQSIWDKC